MRKSLRAYLELTRLSNVATVLSNVLVGFAIGAASSAEPVQWWPLLLITPAMILLYVGGMALNDVVDVNIDRIERPTRPLPSGRISVLSASAFAGGCMVLGIVLLAPFGWPARFFTIALVLTIIAYDVVHKVTPLSGVLMGACRSLVYLAVASCVAWPLDWAVALPLSLAMLAYIAVVTLIARVEAGDVRGAIATRRWAIALPLIALAPVLWITPQQWPAAIGLGLVMIGWLVLAQRHVLFAPVRVQRAVLALLAGICLLDAFYLSLLQQEVLAVFALACFGITLVAHRFVSGT